MSALDAIGALAVGLIVAGGAYLVGGKRSTPTTPATGNGAKKDAWLAAVRNALNYEHPDDSFVFASYEAPENAATFDDARALVDQWGGGNVLPLMDTIMRPESGGDFNRPSNFTKIPPPRPLTQMTVQEVLDWQEANKRAGARSTAAGGFQIINPTLESLVSQGVLNPTERFDENAQMRAGVALADRRGLSAYQRGELTPEAFANNLAKEWAGLPVVSGSKAGRSYYAGDGLNAAGVSPEAILAAIRKI